MKTKFFKTAAMLIVALVMVSSLAIMTFAAEGETDFTGWTDLTSGGGRTLVDGGKYYLTSDIEISGSLSIISGTATLDLNGYVLKSNGFTTDRMININQGAKLIIQDSKPDREHYGTMEYKDDRGKSGLWTYTPDDSGNVLIQGGIITGGRGDHHGATICNQGTLEMRGGTIAGGLATMTYATMGQEKLMTQIGGGAVTNLGPTASMYMYPGAAVAYSVGDFGGGITCWGGARLFMEGGRVYGCHGRIGGGIFVDGCKILPGYDWAGPGVSSDTADSGKKGSFLYFNSGSVHDCVATQGGAGIYVWYHAHMVLNGGSIYDNYAIGNAAGVGVSVGKSTMVMNGGEIFNNEATSNGGGVETIGGEFVMNGGSITNNRAGNDGGGVICGEWTANGDQTSQDVDIGKMTIAGGVISGNVAGRNGGAFYVTGIAKMTGGIVSDCEAQNGGFCYIQLPTWPDHPRQGYPEFHLSGDESEISSCVARENGGAVYINKGTIIMSGGTISNCKAGMNGGAYCALSGSITMSGGALQNNIATEGAAAYITGGSMTMTNGTITENMAVKGGGVYVDGGNFTMQSGSLTNNGSLETTQYGGAAYVNDGSVFIGIETCTKDAPVAAHAGAKHPTVMENSAQFGGGFMIEGGALTMYCCKVISNHADNAGSGENIFLEGGDFTQYYYGVEIGSEENHGVVLVGGNMEILGMGAVTMIQINYHSNYGLELVWSAEAPEDYWLNLPYCPEEWSAEQAKVDKVFIGWSVHPNGMTEVDAIRGIADYLPVGHEFQVKDLGMEAGEIHLYALWGPLYNNIFYAYSIDGVTIEQTTAEDAIFSGLEMPSYYQYTQITTEVYVPGYADENKPHKTGYTFVEWKMYAKRSTISNWGSDANIAEPIEPTLLRQITDRTPNMRDEFAWPGKVQQNFGDIVLVAVFTENVVTFNYQLVLAEEGCATLDLDRETVRVVTETPNGSKVTLDDGFKLRGWFADEACTIPAEDPDVMITEEGKVSTLTPSVENVWENVTYTFYAKVVYSVEGSVTLKEEEQYLAFEGDNTLHTPSDTGWSALFHVRSPIEIHSETDVDEQCYLTFENPLPVDTKLIFVWLDRENGKPMYYHYTVTASTPQQINFKEFVAMGTSTPLDFTAAEKTDARFIITVDYTYADVTTTLTQPIGFAYRAPNESIIDELIVAENVTITAAEVTGAVSLEESMVAVDLPSNPRYDGKIYGVLAEAAEPTKDFLYTEMPLLKDSADGTYQGTLIGGDMILFVIGEYRSESDGAEKIFTAEGLPAGYRFTWTPVLLESNQQVNAWKRIPRSKK